MKRILIVIFLIAVVVFVAKVVLAGSVERVSVNSSGTQGNESSFIGKYSISSDGRYVALISESTNFVSGDGNGAYDDFVYDRESGEIERVNIDGLGNEGNGPFSASFAPSISDDGRYVAFESTSTNLVPGDTNGLADSFVYDRETNTIERVSVDSLGNEVVDGSSYETHISGDGRYVSFASDSASLIPDDTNGLMDVFVHDRTTGETERVSVDSLGNEADVGSTVGGISEDGRYVAFMSVASNLVSNDTNGVIDAFVHDRTTGETERVSVDNSGNQANLTSIHSSSAISSDGRYVGFLSNATNLVSGDTNGFTDAFVYDRTTNSIERVSIDSSGNQANGNASNISISATGRFVVFSSIASNLVVGDTNGEIDIFVYDREDDSIEAVPEASDFSAGYQTPHINLRGYITETPSRTVDLVVWAPVTVTSYEISNTPDFKIKESYSRESLEKNLLWDLCKGSESCLFGLKKVYARFYLDDRPIGEKVLGLAYLPKKECPYFRQYLRMGSRKNTPEEVMKMQEFLNSEVGSHLNVDGTFGTDTDRAVRVFQEKYPTQIIRPWPTLEHSTGWWYITTSGYANVLVGC